MADEPVATGTLAKTPLAHLLIYLEQKSLSGTLAIWPDVVDENDRRQDRILFLKGRAVAGRMMEPATSLREGMLRLFDRREAPYAFYESNLLGGTEDRLNGRVDPYSLIAEALRIGAREEVIDAVVQRVSKARLRIAPNVDFSRFELQNDERAAIDLLLAEPISLEQLEASELMTPVACKRLVYLLLITKSVAPYEAPAAAGGAEPPPLELDQAAVATATTEAAPDADAAVPGSGGAGASKSPVARLERLADLPSPPENLSPELLERWTKIVARARLIENQNYFEMLGLDKKAAGPEIKAEFFKLAKDYHPDRLPSELGALRSCVETIFGYLNEAYKTLDDEEQRIAYLRTVREGGGTPAAERMMQQILDSAIAYERVQVFARKRQFDDALELIQVILAATKDEPDYHAMLAHILMNKFPPNDAPVAKIIESLDRALELHPEHEKAHESKAKMMQRLGKPAEALKHWRRVAAINPNNVDAAREVRIAGMREAQDKQSPKATAVGFLGRLLKSDKDKAKSTKKR
ncbi:MAG TPA: DnaJ domain-containing protein [Polyangiales bacterium]|nr:DnaJ domain-containing protein [Polyangiales bacterium]